MDWKWRISRILISLAKKTRASFNWRRCSGWEELIQSITSIDRSLTICGIQHTTNDIDSTAINLANALSSAVVTISGAGPVIVKSGFALEEDLVTRLRTPALRLSLLSALETARLHQTIDRQRPVPNI